MKMKNTSKSKEQLEASSEEYREALEHDMHDLVERAKSILTGAVVVGAGFWVAYRLFKSLTENNSKEVDHVDYDASGTSSQDEPSVWSVIKHTLMKELAIFILGILKEKIVEYMQEITNDETDS